MTNILNTVAEYYGRFIPSKPSEYLALQIARTLGDGTAFRHYLVLFERYPLELILKAYEQCAHDGRLTGDQFMSNFRILTD
jgi:hypothetical protein